MHGLDTIKAINDWAASKECKALIEAGNTKAKNEKRNPKARNKRTVARTRADAGE